MMMMMMIYIFWHLIFKRKIAFALFAVLHDTVCMKPLMLLKFSELPSKQFTLDCEYECQCSLLSGTLQWGCVMAISLKVVRFRLRPYGQPRSLLICNTQTINFHILGDLRNKTKLQNSENKLNMAES